MEIVLAIAIGVLTGSGVWLLLRPRTFQVIMGLSLISYAVNLFIFSMGSRIGASSRCGMRDSTRRFMVPRLPMEVRLHRLPCRPHGRCPTARVRPS